jgi:DNA-binding CsgD family transcriptional regulator
VFEALGLRGVTELVYLTLLESPGVDPVSFAQQLDLDKHAVSQALDELERLSLLKAPSPDQTALWPVSPERALAVLMARQEEEMAGQQKKIEEAKAAFAYLVKHAASRPKQPPSGLKYLEGTDALRTRTRDLVESCQSEASVFVPGGPQTLTSLQISRMMDIDLVRRGVRLRAVYLDSVRSDRLTLDYMTRLSDFGGQVRTVPTLPLPMLVVDGRLAIAVANIGEVDAPAVVISNRTVLEALSALFDMVWKAAQPLGPTKRRDSDGLSAEERHILKLLAGGLTDEATARRLGVSVRTARRKASDLIARLGARSRFQAGAQALARGWIGEDDLG